MVFMFYTNHKTSLLSSITDSKPNFTLKSPIEINHDSKISPDFTFLINFPLFVKDDLEVSTIYYEFVNTLIWVCVVEILFCFGYEVAR